jgi:hypothetical protein
MAEIPPSFSSVTTLGKPRAWFPVNNWNRIGNLVIALIMLAGACLVFLYGIYDASVAFRKHGLAVLDEKLFLPLVIAGIMFLLGGLGGWGAYVNWNKGALLCERGFVLRTHRGDQSWAWTEIVSFTAAITRNYTNGIYTGTTHVYTLLNCQGRRLVLSDFFKGVEKLAQEIEQAVSPILYDRAAAQYNSGQTVLFGPVAVNKAGIQIGKKHFPWQEVGQVSIRQGILNVSKKDGGWFSGASAAASAIPNLRVLLSILHQLVGIKAG